MKKLFLIILLFGLLCACSSPRIENEGDIVDNETLIITDALGNDMSLLDYPSRIVITGIQTPMIVDLFYLFPQAAQRIVAIENRSQTMNIFLEVIDPASLQKMILEKGAGAEQIAPLNPDLVAMKTVMKEQVGDPLQEIEIPVFYLGMETIPQIYQDIQNIGDLLGDPTRAAEVLAYYQQRTSFVQEKVQNIPEEERPSVLLLQYTDSAEGGVFKVPSAAWLQTVLVENAGGLPVWKDEALGSGWLQVNFEQIAAWDADIILVVCYKSDSSTVVRDLMQDSTWQQLNAVKNGDIFGFPADFISWDQPDTRWILALQWLAKTLHPDIFASLDIQTELIEFYNLLYGLSPDIVQQEILPLLKGDL